MRQSILPNVTKNQKRTNDGSITPAARRGKSAEAWLHPFQRFHPSLICKILNAQGLEFTIQDINQPNPLKVLEVYEAFSETICDKVLDDFREFTDAEMEILGEDDSHLDSLILQKFSKHLTRLFQVLHFNDFNLEDLIYPSSPRFYATLCALISFWQYFEMRTPEIEELKAKEIEVISRKNEVELSNDQFFEEFEKLRLSNEIIAPTFDELKKLYMETTKEAHVMGATHNYMCDKSKELTEIHRAKKLELNELHEKIASLEALCQNLEKKLIIKPEILIEQLKKTKEKHRIKTADLQNSKSLVQSIKTQKENRLTVTKEIKIRKDTMLQCIEEKHIHEELQAEMTKLISEADELKSRISDLDANIKGQEQIVDYAKKKEEILKLSTGKKLKDLEDGKEALDTKMSLKDTERISKQANLNQLLQKLDKLDLQAANIISKTDLELDTLRRECNALNEKIDVYITTLNQSVFGTYGPH